MTPLVLLLTFFALAMIAFLVFAVLTFMASTTQREDWKKFLGSFAGTALGLSVGFGSFMLQQANQSTQRQNEEIGNIKARLLYSIVQKKFEIDSFPGNGPLAIPKDFEICNSAADVQARYVKLQELRAGVDADEMQFTKEMADKLFSSVSYERNAINKLLKETSLPTRIDQDMLRQLLTLELQVDIEIPETISSMIDLVNLKEIGIKEMDKFCNRARNIRRLQDQLVDAAPELQLTTCVAYAIIGLPKEQSLNKSKSISARIQSVTLGSDDERSSRIEKFQADLLAELADVKPDMEYCLSAAEIKMR